MGKTKPSTPSKPAAPKVKKANYKQKLEEIKHQKKQEVEQTNDDDIDEDSEDEDDDQEINNNEQLDFQWNVFGGAPVVNQSNEEEQEEADEDEEEEKQKKFSKNAKKRMEKLTEESISKREKELSSSNVLPQTYQDYERLLAASPNSSYLWIQYMAHKLSLTEIDGARKIGELALKKIHYREQQEKFNVFAAMMNLESKYGTQESQDEIFRRALQYCDPKQVYVQQGKIYEQHGDDDRADATYNKMCKKFHTSSKVYEVYQKYHICNGNHKKANQILERALRNLDKKKHVQVIVRFALLHYHHGSVIDGHKVFEELISNNPRRTDIWGQFIDAEMSAKRFDEVTQLFTRIVNLNLSTKKMKSFLQRYLKFEREHGTPEGVERVKQVARDYIALKTNT
ncbi:RRP5 [Acrasis kona]|uniref:RRP5 n=1 Tax=Acrasis kona TaxID=1008807 RepID=A0AAW2Z4A5_9EUKA